MFSFWYPALLYNVMATGQMVEMKDTHDLKKKNNFPLFFAFIVYLLASVINTQQKMIKPSLQSESCDRSVW